MLKRHFYSTASCSVLAIASVLAGYTGHAQQPASRPPAPESSQEPATVKPSGPAPFILSSSEKGHDAPAVSEAELRQQLQGKTFYLRSGYLDNTLHFDEKAHLNGNSPQASYTLSLAEITHVRLEKHRLQLEAVRYGLHFLGASPTEDQTAAVDKVRLTTKKKSLVITIDREQVAKPKKEKEKHGKHPGPQSPADSSPAAAAASQPAADTEAESGRHHATTDSEAHANRTLAQALDTVFATGIDDRMIATLPDYWKLFYQSIAEHRAYKSADAAVLRQSEVDQKARLVSVLDPPSNEFAQKNGVAGMAMYHVLIGADGKPREIAVGRPIGFGLDENAVKSIQQAKFEAATKAGQPVPVTLDLVVLFRIYSQRTAQASNRPANASMLPGPYTANAPRPQPAPDAAQPAPDTAQQPTPADTAPPTNPSQPAAPSDAAQQPQQQPTPAPQPQ